MRRVLSALISLFTRWVPEIMKSDTDEQEKKKIDDLDLLEDLKKRIYNAIIEDEPQPKVGDLLKVIELKRKLSVEGKGEKKFWEMVNKLRKDELTESKKSASVKKKAKR